MSIDASRRHEANRIVHRASQSIASHPDVRAIVVVGSYAYGRPTMDSDIDIVVALNNRDAWLRDDSWVQSAVGPRHECIRDQEWGALHERRYRTASGFEIEFGLVTAHWFAIPVDAGTAQVLKDGCRVVIDDELLAREALNTLGLPTVAWAPTGGQDPGA